MFRAVKTACSTWSTRALVADMPLETSSAAPTTLAPSQCGTSFRNILPSSQKVGSKWQPPSLSGAHCCGQQNEFLSKENGTKRKDTPGARPTDFLSFGFARRWRVFRQHIPVLAKNTPASMRASLRTIRHHLAALQGPRSIGRPGRRAHPHPNPLPPAGEGASVKAQGFWPYAAGRRSSVATAVRRRDEGDAPDLGARGSAE